MNRKEKIQKLNKILEDNKNEIIQLYESGLGLDDTRKKFEGISRKRIYNKLKEWGIHVRTISESKMVDVYKKKVSETLLKTYGRGIINVSQADSIKRKKAKTFLNKYGIDNIWKTQDFRNHMIKLGKWRDLSIEEMRGYDNEVWRITETFLDDLYKKWDGNCYYSGAKCTIDKTNYNFPLYRTIDHKISIMYGYKNKIDPVIIGDISNLCICCRKANSIKQELTEQEFLSSERFIRLKEEICKLNL